MRAIFLAIALFCTLEGSEIQRVIHSIPSKDRKRIGDLFAHLIQYDNLGFVLFGQTKTAAFCTIPLSCDYPIFPSVKYPLKYQKHLQQNWMVWNQYKHKFKHPNIIVCEEYDILSQRRFLQLFFIDKKKLQHILDEYKNEFTEVLGTNFSKEKFILQIEKRKKLRPLLKHDEKLIGILLGFGRESSTAFRDLSDNNELDHPLEYLGKRPNGCVITPVSFKGYSRSEEVQKLLNAYQKEITDIERIFKSDTFLEQTLEKFCSP
jgi:hypothetical protein